MGGRVGRAKTENAVDIPCSVAFRKRAIRQQNKARHAGAHSLERQFHNSGFDVMSSMHAEFRCKSRHENSFIPQEGRKKPNSRGATKHSLCFLVISPTRTSRLRSIRLRRRTRVLSPDEIGKSPVQSRLYRVTRAGKGVNQEMLYEIIFRSQG